MSCRRTDRIASKFAGFLATSIPMQPGNRAVTFEGSDAGRYGTISAAGFRTGQSGYHARSTPAEGLCGLAPIVIARLLRADLALR
jgi:hypothetical protein